MKRVIYLASLLFAVLFMNSCDKNESIFMEDLPTAAREFINTHYRGIEITGLVKETEGVDVEYKVNMANRHYLEFDKQGNWKEVKGYNNSVPESIIPTQILTHVKSNFPNQFIVKIERDKEGYEVKLNQGIEISYNHNFEVVDYDY